MDTGPLQLPSLHSDHYMHRRRRGVLDRMCDIVYATVCNLCGQSQRAARSAGVIFDLTEVPPGYVCNTSSTSNNYQLTNNFSKGSGTVTNKVGGEVCCTVVARVVCH